MGKFVPVGKRFWAKVEKSDACWIWLGCKQSQGYGQIRIDGKALLAHRVSWELHHGSLSRELEVCHECDNPACIRPDHLFLGTHRQNMKDCDKKGRMVRGEQHVNAKLTPEDVDLMRQLYASGTIQRVLAERFGITQPHASKIVNGKKWTHLDMLEMEPA